MDVYKIKGGKMKHALNILLIIVIIICLLGYLGSTIQWLAICFLAWIILSEIWKEIVKGIKDDVLKEQAQKKYEDDIKKWIDKGG